jgi:NTE family protein
MVNTKTVGLALSGGGFRATLFHIGALWRLNELGWLPRLREVTSVSGGSIVAAYLGMKWNKLQFNEGVAQNLSAEVFAPLRAFCARDHDVSVILRGLANPFRRPGDLMARRYRRFLFDEATLADLPTDDEGPRFTIYATSLQTGSSVRLSRPYLADYRVGMLESPKMDLGTAVAASSGFPPVMCPIVAKFDPNAWRRVEGADLYDDPKYRSRLYLADGGIYDNLGVERLWKMPEDPGEKKFETLLVSDAGAPFSTFDRSLLNSLSQLARTKRTLDIAVEQTRALRKRWLVKHCFQREQPRGTYWGVDTQIEDYAEGDDGLADLLAQDGEVTRSLSAVRTRLNAFDATLQERLIAWGYALADAGMRRFVLPAGAKAGTLPFDVL